MRITDLAAIKQHWDKVLEVLDHRPSSSDLEPASSDSSADCVLVQEEGPTSTREDFKRKCLEGKEWWTTFFADEETFWAGVDEGVDQVPFPVMGNNPFLSFPKRLASTNQSGQDMVVAALEAMDRISVGDNERLLSDDLRQRLENLRATSLQLSPRDFSVNLQATNDLQLYSSEGTVPDRAESGGYSAATDLEAGHVAIVRVEAHESTMQRGWELVEVKTIRAEQVIGVYLMPVCRPPLQYRDDNDFPVWPNDWASKQLTRIMFGTRQRVAWTCEIEVSSVLFSFKPTKAANGVISIPPRYKYSLNMAILAIQNQTVPNHLDSDEEA
jgi:hypothetical protein